jgi:hypothetical protein
MLAPCFDTRRHYWRMWTGARHTVTGDPVQAAIYHGPRWNDLVESGWVTREVRDGVAVMVYPKYI